MSAIARNQVFSAVHTVGGLLPTDMLVRISEGKDVPGSKPADYNVFGVRSVSDEAERHWDYLKGVWRELRTKLPTATDGTPAVDSVNAALSQWLEPLFNELGFGRLPAVPGEGLKSDDGAKSFTVSHLWQHVPVHVVAWHHELDKRSGGVGTVPPQSHVQELLNSSSAHLWAVLTNGRQVRLLRDSSALATAAYVEFDLEAIFDGELFNEFVLLYRLLHASRFEVEEGKAPSSCWLEKWRADAVESGSRALKHLSENVREAITVLGTGFLRANPDLRKDLDLKAFHAALLRLVYRMLFVFVAEDRGALHPPGTSEQAKERYAAYFSTARLRRHARRRRGTAHNDQYEALKLLLAALGGTEKHPDGRPELGIPALGGLFTDTEADAPLRGLKLANEHLLGAVRHLSQVRDAEARRWRTVNYRDLDAEELGSIYESLLELVPKYNASDLSFELKVIGGNDRKTTGSYYTPSSLIETLLDSALDPVIDDAVKRGHEKATKAGQPDSTEAVVGELLELTVCDPACGSGHFLVAAARRIAKQVAAVREGNPEPTVGAVRSAMHDVVARCIYGVDLNPMAVELAKVSLWLEALEPGKPLNFLDAHVKHGNALIGATPSLIKGGIPDEAFKPIEGDDKKYARFLAKTNSAERGGQLGLFDIKSDAAGVANTALAEGLREITSVVGDSLDQVRDQEKAYQGWTASDEYVRNRRVADAWCAAFVWRKTQDAPQAVTQEVLYKLANAKGNGAPFTTIEEIERLREQYRFFHWHLEFPDVFGVPEDGRGADEATGWAGGFDCMMGNPPWERIKLQEQEFFAQRDRAIAEARNAAERKRMIADLKADASRSVLYQEFEEAKRRAEGESHFLRMSGRYLLTGRGDINTYAVFSEADRMLTGPHGRTGIIVPTGIATDATTQHFFKDLVEKGSIAALYDFENAAPLFEGVHRSFKFCILSLAGRDMREPEASFAFFLHDPAELDDADKAFTMTPEEIKLLSPNTGACPTFRSRRDVDIVLGMYSKGAVLRIESESKVGSGFRVRRIYDMGKKQAVELCKQDSGSVRDVTMYEAKMLHAYDHRFATYVVDGGDVVKIDEKESPDVFPVGRYALKNPRQLDDDLRSWGRNWLLVFRDIARSTDERTMISSIIPRTATDYTVRVACGHEGKASVLLANFNSMPFDYVCRNRLGGAHLSDFITYQLPRVSWGASGKNGARGWFEMESWINSRVLELTYTAFDMEPFARDLGDEGAPFRWNEERRTAMRAELDALFFHLYGISRDDVDYIIETFPIVKRKDVEKYGTYRTKERILEIYDRMAQAGVSQDTPLVDGENFVSELTPPPGHGPRHVSA
ncbi:Eco57I restriction-modification methylase domain-containing protein [Nocardiopsis algeriensis]|uniref:site-specific DNA-methyltransferase (adenine-specific) n=1 Tax=Nocardiopsis algeriensis TaxID=1478215 RepID=A0A841IN41_9ACTN|nr:DNA methyltransferase [Nocardiopsis algeriensis]MBB6119494.1 hypothetical protein [Nocardiopsis algeriensis]